MRRLLETRSEPNIKKQIWKLREHRKKIIYRYRQNKDWNRRIKAGKYRKVETERRKIY